MPTERKVRRYAAFFPGWATAFGTHDQDASDPRLFWLHGENQLGLILSAEIKHLLYPLFLGHSHEEAPKVVLGAGVLSVEGVELNFGDHRDSRAYRALMDLLQGEGDLHLFQTYHLIYPSGTRILTLGRKAPLPLVYREIAPLLIQLI